MEKSLQQKGRQTITRLNNSQTYLFLFDCYSTYNLLGLVSLKTLTSLNKEVKPFFLSDNSIWSFPSVSSLAITAFGGPEDYFSLAITAFGAFEYMVPKYYHRFREMQFNESSLLI